MNSPNQVRQEIISVASNEALAQHADHWRRCKLLAVDSEFMRSRTYFPVAGLIQINDGCTNFLLDPHNISDFAPLKDVFADTSVLKVLHACSEDLEVFQRVLGQVPRNILDTQIAAAMLNYGFSLGFANLCQLVLGIELPKAETRSNWLQRPLSEAQIQYAAMDVEYLTPVAVHLIKRLQQLHRLNWLREECERLGENYEKSQSPEMAWKRGRGLWKLSPTGLRAYRALAAWRERTAQQRDVPRNRILKENIMMALAVELPADTSELTRVEGLSRRLLQNDGEVIISLLQQAIEQEDVETASVPTPLPSSAKELTRRLRAWVQQKAEELGIAQELLMRKKEYEDFIRSGWHSGEYCLQDEIQGWRRALLEKDLVRIAWEAKSKEP